MKSLSDLKIGDSVFRMLCGIIPMELQVTDIRGNYIYCGCYKFSAKNGAEIDEEIDWDENKSGAFLVIEI